IRNRKYRIGHPPLLTVRFAISDFGFKVLESSNFKISAGSYLLWSFAFFGFFFSRFCLSLLMTEVCHVRTSTMTTKSLWPVRFSSVSSQCRLVIEGQSLAKEQTMRSRFFVLIGAMLLVFSAVPVVAHHGWSGNQDEEFQLTGTVESGVSLAGPHATMKVRAQGQVWDLTLAP